MRVDKWRALSPAGIARHVIGFHALDDVASIICRVLRAPPPTPP